MVQSYKSRISDHLKKKYRSFGYSKRLSDRKIQEYIINFDIQNSTNEDLRNFMAWLQVELRTK